MNSSASSKAASISLTCSVCESVTGIPTWSLPARRSFLQEKYALQLGTFELQRQRNRTKVITRNGTENDNEPLDEKTNREIPGTLRKATQPRITRIVYGLRVVFLRFSKTTLLNSGLSPKFSSNPTSISVALR